MQGGSEVENVRLVNTFPSFTSISVVDNIFATLWAGIIQDVEVVVSDFLMTDGWDYSTLLRVAEARKISVLHRCAFSLFAPDRNLQYHADRTRRGRYREQLLAYKRIVSTILNAAKDVWLEPQQAFPGRSELMDLKRHVCGLFLLYYLWHNQIPADPHKVLIKYSIEDERRARVVGEKFLRLEKDIPNSDRVKKCYQFVVTALSKRNALCYTYIVDEPKLDYGHWQHVRLKNGVVRKALTAVNSNSQFYRALAELEITCSYMTEIIQEVRDIAATPTEKSLFFRRIMPEAVIKDMILVNDVHRPVKLSLPFDYSDVLIDMSNVISKNLNLLERPFLHIDYLLQTDKAPQKIRSVGMKLTKEAKQRQVYHRKTYEQRKFDFNRLCDINEVPAMKISKTRKYRPMESPAWLFIARKFDKMFTELDGKAGLRSKTRKSGVESATAGTSGTNGESADANTSEGSQDTVVNTDPDAVIRDPVYGDSASAKKNITGRTTIVVRKGNKKFTHTHPDETIGDTGITESAQPEPLDCRAQQSSRTRSSARIAKTAPSATQNFPREREISKRSRKKPTYLESFAEVSIAGQQAAPTSQGHSENPQPTSTVSTGTEEVEEERRTGQRETSLGLHETGAQLREFLQHGWVEVTEESTEEPTERSTKRRKLT